MQRHQLTGGYMPVPRQSSVPRQLPKKHNGWRNQDDGLARRAKRHNSFAPWSVINMLFCVERLFGLFCIEYRFKLDLEHLGI